MALCPALDESNEMIYQKLEVNIDETDLKTVAEIAGGRYFRAKNEESLKTVFAQIGTLIDE